MRRLAADAVPDLDVYREMLTESGATGPRSSSSPSSAKKRRRLDESLPSPSTTKTPTSTSLPTRALTVPSTSRPALPVVTAKKSVGKEVQASTLGGSDDADADDGDDNNVDNDENDQDDSSSSDDSDTSVDWEDVDLSAASANNPHANPPSSYIFFSNEGWANNNNNSQFAVPVYKPKEVAKPVPLEVVLDESSSSKNKLNGAQARRKVTSIDRKIRLEGHKLHLLCLIAHVHRRNKWCSDPEVIVSSIKSRNISYGNTIIVQAS